MPEEGREFVVGVRRWWTLWILPVLALVYFVAVLVLAALDYEVQGVPQDVLVWIGVGLFALVLLLEIPLLLTRRAVVAPPAAPPPAPPETGGTTVWTPGPEAAPALRLPADDEVRTTEERQQGLQVLEYAVPAKGRHPGAVYAKAYVPVTKEHVLRVETLAADAHEL